MSDNRANGYSLKEGEGTKINFRGTKMTLKVSGCDSEGKFSLIGMLHPPNTGPLYIYIQMLPKPTVCLMTAIL